MALKSNKENKKTKTASPKKDVAKKSSPKSEINEDEDDDLDGKDAPVKKTGAKKPSKKVSSKNEDDEDDVEIDDEWEKPVEEEGWDPDFAEFDLPKSKGKKAAIKKSPKDDDDFKIDDDFKDLGFDDIDGDGPGHDDDY